MEKAEDKSFQGRGSRSTGAWGILHAPASAQAVETPLAAAKIGEDGLPVDFHVILETRSAFLRTCCKQGFA